MACARRLGINMGGHSWLRGRYRIGRVAPGFHVLLWTVAGRGGLTVRHPSSAPELHALEAGSRALLPADSDYHYELKGRREWEIVWLHLRRSAPGIAGWPQERECVAAAQAGDLAMAAVDGMLREVDGLASGCGDAIEAFASLLEVAMRREAAEVGEAVALLHRRELEELWHRVDADLSHPWTVGELARAIHVSEGHLHRIVAASYRTTPMRRVADLRMRRARALLAESELAVFQIAAAVGFENPYAFSAAFRRLHRISPRDFRMRAREETEARSPQ